MFLGPYPASRWQEPNSAAYVSVNRPVRPGICLREAQSLSFLQTTRPTLVRPAQSDNTTVACKSAEHIRITDHQTEGSCDVAPRASPTIGRRSPRGFHCRVETHRVNDNVGLGWSTLGHDYRIIVVQANALVHKLLF